MAVSSPSYAGELFGGAYVHDTSVPFKSGGPEDGMDVQVGWRGERIGKTPLQPYGFLAVNSSGGTNYGAIGLSARFGQRLFIRPGLGIAVHTGSAANHFIPENDDIEFGSRILFEPEVGAGARLGPRFSVEGSWIHMSHGQLFGRQNSGINNLGVRLTYQLH
jgi:hypothetical protein